MKFGRINCIYKIFNKENNKVYIGSTSDFLSRIYWHKVRLISNQHHSPFLQEEWNKNNKVFEFDIIEQYDENFDREELYKREQH